MAKLFEFKMVREVMIHFYRFSYGGQGVNFFMMQKRVYGLNANELTQSLVKLEYQLKPVF